MGNVALLILTLLAVNANLALRAIEPQRKSETGKRQLLGNNDWRDWSDSSESESDENDIVEWNWDSVEEPTDLASKRETLHNCSVCVILETSKDHKSITRCGSIDSRIECHPSGDRADHSHSFSNYCLATQKFVHLKTCNRMHENAKLEYLQGLDEKQRLNSILRSL